MRPLHLARFLLLLFLAPVVRAEPPNIVMIVGDDHGYPYFGFTGSDVVKTPRLDDLARSGTVFPVTYMTASLCRPSLMTLLTGLHPYEWEQARLQLRNSGTTEFRGREIVHFTTLPAILKTAGYVSFQAGKLWEGSYEMAGFSEGTKTEFDPERSERGLFGGEEGLRVGRETMQPVYDFIDRHRETPFFLWFAPMLPHRPFDAPAQFLEIYEGQEIPDSTRLYYANVSRFDAVVGDLIDHLEKRGLRDRTLVVFVSDNGFDVSTEWDARGRSTGGPRGKGSLHELGLRSPLIVSWPQRIPAGREEPALVSSVDLFQTLLDYAGLAPLAGRTGHSLRPVLEGHQASVRDEVIGSTRRPVLVRDPEEAPDDPRNRFKRTFFIRTPQWHYIWDPERELDALYDIADDPDATTDVSTRRSGVTTRLRVRINLWRRRLKGRVERKPVPVPAAAP